MKSPPVQKLVVDSPLDQDPVGRDAGLAGVPELGGHQPGHGGLPVGRVEDKERSVAAQLQGHSFGRQAASGVEVLANLASSSWSTIIIIINIVISIIIIIVIIIVIVF